MNSIVPRALIERHRDINVQDEWYSSVYVDFTRYMKQRGVHVERIYFSGFGSQGDGACFEGHIEDWGKYLWSINVPDPTLAKAADKNWTFSWTHDGRYYHYNSVNFDDSGVYFPDSPWYTKGDEGDELRHSVWMANIQQHDLLGLCEDIKDNLKKHMQQLYRNLEEEYDYLTSDEEVSDSIIGNDLLTEDEEN